MVDQIAAPGPRTSVDPRVEDRLSVAGRVIRWTSVCYAFVGLAGLYIPILREIPPAPSLIRDMTPVAAVSLAILAVGALLSGDAGRGIFSGSVRWWWIGFALSLMAGLIGLTIIAVFFADRTDVWGEVLQVPAFSVGVILVLLGAAVPLSSSRREAQSIVGQVAALLVFSLAAVIFMGYVFGDPSVGRLFLRPAISFQATILAVLIATGVLLMPPASGLLSTVASPGPGGRLLRWLGPTVLVTPAGLLVVAETVPSTERVDALAFISVGLGLLLLILLAVFVRVLDRTSIEAATNAAQAERAEVGLRQEAPVVQRLAEMLHIVELDSVEGWEVATRYRPGIGAVAGDASAVHLLPDGSVALVLVDVTGHGAHPAVWAIRVRDLLLQSLFAGKDPAEAMTLVDWSAPGDLLASAMVVQLDATSGEVRLSSAGHPPAILVGTSGAELKTPTGPLLYLDADAGFGEERFQMAPGDTLVAFSDGVADVQLSENGRTEPERLANHLLVEGGLASRTAELVLAFARPEPRDDQTVVVVRRLP
ncbi:MAG TPA: PP2C family protein-serine/threonine phosphatase [Acidimicrobiia bacterium]|nr:PP2C family protein-serine/threonine phosphatase [Acidimicrobiia bacterium]